MPPALTDGTQAGTITAAANNQTPIATAAPKVSTSDQQASPVAPATPPAVPNATSTPIVSSDTAKQHVDNTIVPTMTAAEQAIAAQSAARKASGTDGYVYNVKQPDGTYYSGLKSAMPAPVTPTPGTTTNAQSALEQQIANSPDAGHRFVYDKNGAVQIPVDMPLPAGFSETNPNPPAAPTAQPTSSITTDTGTRVDLMPGGAVAMYDAAGNFTGYGTQQDLTAAQNNSSQYQRDQAISKSNDTLSKIDAIANGTYPLSADQQAQIDGIKSQYQALIDQQITANKNATGATTLAENMYGMGNTLTGIGQIDQVVKAGQMKVDDLNNKMNAAVAQMRSGFMKDDLSALQTAYADYTDVVKQRQAAIDNLTSQVQTQAQQAAVDSAIGDQLTKGVSDPVAILDALKTQGIAATAKQVNDALANLNPKQTAVAALLKTAADNGAPSDIMQAIGNSKTLADAYSAAGKYAASGAGIIGEYNNAIASGGYTGSLTDFISAVNAAESQGTATGKVQASIASNLDASINIPLSSVIAAENNNPMNLKFAGQKGAAQGSGGFAKFDNAGDGYKAGIAQVEAYQTGKMSSYGITGSSTIADMAPVWASSSTPKQQNDWVNNVATKLGVTPDTAIGGLDTVNLANAIAFAESSTTIVTLGTPDPNVSPDAAQPSLGGMSFNGLKTAAQEYIDHNGKMPLLGRNTSEETQAARLAVINYAGKISSGNPAQQAIAYNAISNAQKNITTRLAATRAAQVTALDNLTLAEEASKTLPRTGSTLANRYLQWSQGNLTTNTGLTTLETYIYTAAREYAKVTSGGAGSVQGLTDSASREASKLLNAAQSPENFQAAVSAMKQDMSNAVSGMTEEQSVLGQQATALATDGQKVTMNEQDAQTTVVNAAKADPKIQSVVYNMLKAGNNGEPMSYSDVLTYLKSVGPKGSTTPYISS